MRRYKTVLDELNAAKMRLQQESAPKMDRRNSMRRTEQLYELRGEVKLLELELLQTVRCKDCKYLQEIFCHPTNKNIGKGSIIERLGWVCTPPEFKDKIYFFDNKDGYCELFEQKKKNSDNEDK
jgi:hypothetical protein